MRGKKAPRKRASKALPNAASGGLAVTLEPLALELYGIIRAALTQYGLSSARQRQLFAKSERKGAAHRVSARLLYQYRCLGDLLSTWMEESPYIDSATKPKILPIRGRGATFERLAKKYLPDKSLEAVVALALRTANVGTLEGNRIALYGDTMVNFAKLPESLLSQMVLHVCQVVDTCRHNAERSPEDPTLPRLERLVHHAIGPREFDDFQRAMRPQLHDICEKADRLLKSHARRGRGSPRARGHGGIGIYVYYDGTVKHVSHRGNRSRV